MGFFSKSHKEKNFDAFVNVACAECGRSSALSNSVKCEHCSKNVKTFCGYHSNACNCYKPPIEQRTSTNRLNVKGLSLYDKKNSH